MIDNCSIIRITPSDRKVNVRIRSFKYFRSELMIKGSVLMFFPVRHYSFGEISSSERVGV